MGKTPTALEQSYPHMTLFVNAFGWIEVGYNAESPVTSVIRAVDPGGMMWNSKDACETSDEAFPDLGEGLDAARP
jgi:hypothetical protein